MEYLLVGDEQKRKTESKNAKKDPRAANSSISWVWLLKRGEKKFLNAKTSPLSSLLYFGAEVARPGELSLPRRANLHFFFFLRGTLTMSPPFSWISVLPNLNLLKLELGVDYLFLFFKTNK